MTEMQKGRVRKGRDVENDKKIKSGRSLSNYLSFCDFVKKNMDRMR